jgi:hypothetical protein
MIGKDSNQGSLAQFAVFSDFNRGIKRQRLNRIEP